ncbi:hypothetical protein HWV62_32055 [Athelia sp. TMB]|nr:hypothetical protein HWV62_32055 [Athelia sp. TMB]
MSQSPGEYPGFHLPLNYTPSGGLFPNAIDCEKSEMRLTPLREFTMMRLMNEITDKPDWDSKIFDETIVAKWKAEALSADQGDVTQKMVNYCIAELRYKTKSYQKTGLVTAYDGDVVKSDVIVPEELRLALKAAAAPLEQVPAVDRDWHPDSDDLVLDLVHPSLFPVVYGTTRILRNSTVTLDNCLAQCGSGEVIPVPDKPKAKARGAFYEAQRNGYSQKFQWLPCDVEFTGDEDAVQITSYINNLHPKKFKPLYNAIEKIIAKSIVLWNRTLDDRTSDVRVPFDGPEYEIQAADQIPEQETDEDDDDYDQRVDDSYEDRRRAQELSIILPEPGEFSEPVEGDDVDILNLREDFKESGLQVIVKLANIHLTPEKPQYGGGSWHVEGQLNEHICATALYYYDCENITESRLAFRQQSEAESCQQMPYEQSHDMWLTQVYGCLNWQSSVQEVGDVLAKEGRLITFPNVFQHRVLPFKLADPTKPGHRKILALFLVDPHVKVISSANVPCQRRDWWAKELEQSGALPAKLPLEMKQEVVGNMEDSDFPISLKEAKKLRLELMEERKHYGRIQDKQFNSTTFSLCEH